MRFYVYIMASFSGTLYVGLTTDIERRAWEHRNRRTNGFTAKYNINRLVYYERYDLLLDAFARERQIKRWRRSKKVALIERKNPNWNDLAMTDEEFEREYLQW